MRTKVSTLAVAWIAAALLLAWAAGEFRAARRMQAARAEMALRLKGAAADADAARARATAAGRTAADLRDALEAAKMSGENAAERRKKSPRPTLDTLLATNPKVRAIYLKSYQARLAVTYLPLYHRLKLGPAEIAKFNDLLSEREEERIDLQATAEAHGLPASDPAILAVKQQQDDDLHRAEIGLLGADGFQQVGQIERLQPLFDLVVTPLMSVIPAGAAPLTEAQGEQLLTVLSRSNSAFQAGGKADPLAIDWSTTLPQTRGFLSDAQYAGIQAWSQALQVRVLIKQYYQLQAATK